MPRSDTIAYSLLRVAAKELTQVQFKNLLVFAAMSLFSVSITWAEEDAQELRYFVIMAKPSGAVWETLMNSPIDPEENARKFIEEHIEGAKLIEYYLLAGKPMNLAIIAVPDSRDVSAIMYQRMATQLVEDIEVFEVIPGNEFAKVLDAAKTLKNIDAYSNEN